MNILLAPNSMKGSLNAFYFADIIEEALLHSGIKCTIRKVPVADGGDLTGEILSRVTDANSIKIEVTGPLGSPVNAVYWMRDKKAIIEMAQASGISLIKPEKLNPLKASSFGTGQLIADAVARGCDEIWLAVGGSATVDGGTGMLEAMEFRLFDKNGMRLKGNGENLEKLARIQKAKSNERISFKIICDVNNTLLGENGAAKVFGPQKGASSEMIQTLENGLKNWSEILYRETGKVFSDLNGVGAAGGIALPLLAFYNSALEEGASFVLDQLGFTEHVQWADIVVTGEGKIDFQTRNLKAPYVVAKTAHKFHKPVYAFAGIADKFPNNIFNKIYVLTDNSITKEEAMKNTGELLFQKVLEFAKQLKKYNDE